MGFKVPEKYRFISPGHPYSSNKGDLFGVFHIPYQSFLLNTLATNGKGIVGEDFVEWEHISVSLKHRCPNWAEMCFIKDLFWDSEDCVVQFHPPKSQYVNNHPNVLHLWRPANKEFPMPPSIFVGLVGASPAARDGK